jgi:hypothetical protein
MNVLMILLRSIHILAGIFWAGTAFFFVLSFEPTLKASGPAGGTVMGRLTISKFPLWMAIASILTVGIGFVMYLIDSHVLQVSWIATPAGITMTIGSLAGIAAFIEGLVVQVPSTNRMAALQQEILAAGGQPTPAQMEEVQALQAKISKASRLGAALMLIAVIGMASARELGNI